jgi:hypothetical protein
MLARILWLLSAALILVLAFFFLAAAIAAGAVLAAILLARIWWVNRRIRRAAEDGILSAEYTVVEREGQQGRLPEKDAGPPPGDRSAG